MLDRDLPEPPPEMLEPVPDDYLQEPTTPTKSRQPSDIEAEHARPEKDASETDEELGDETAVSRQWRGFVEEVAKDANVSLVSLLRNAVVLELNEQNLVIGFRNTQLFTEEKRARIEETARSYFNDTIQVIYRESLDGLDDSLKRKHDLALEKEHAEIRDIARKDKKVSEILEVFPQAEIDEITILEKGKE